ncbi:hypothetical protein ABK040_011522 [Willaertia magna]
MSTQTSSPFEAYLRNFEGFKNSNDFTKLYKLLTDLREYLEITTISEYTSFTNILLRPLLDYLNEQTKPKFKKDDKENLLRQLVIEIIQRLPYAEIFKDKREELFLVMNTLLSVLRNDNEQNGSLAVKIIMEIHRSFRSHLPNFVQPFIDILLQFYSNFEGIIEKYFGKPPKRDKSILSGISTEEISTNSTSYSSLPSSNDELLHSMESCKIMLEFPIFMIFLFQTYNQFVGENNNIIRKMIESFEFEVYVNENTLISMNSFARERIEDFMVFRVKTISYLAFTLRFYKESLIGNKKEIIPRFIMKCLRECPDECITARREILLIMRHIVENNQLDNLKNLFAPFINEMLDDTILIGKSRSAYESVRTLAYSTVLEIIVNSKNEFNLSQIAKSLVFSTKIMFDPTLNQNIHNLAVDLLVRLAECIYKNVQGSMITTTTTIEGTTDMVGDSHQHLTSSTPNTSTTTISTSTLSDKELEQQRELVFCIMRTFIQKLKYVSDFIKRLTELKKSQYKDPTEEEIDENSTILPFSSYKKIESLSESILNCRHTFRYSILGMRNITFVLVYLCKDDVNRTLEELPLLTKLFKYGLDCFEIYNISDDGVPEGGDSKRFSDEEKDTFNNFSSLFTSLPPIVFSEIFKSQLSYLYNKLLEGRSHTYIHIPAYILSSNPSAASTLSDILLKFLLKKMDRIPKDKKEAQYIYNLYKSVFGSIITFPKNEIVLKAHLTNIVTSCFNYASKYKDCLDYYFILRTLFKSIVTAKFDMLCKEFAPLLPSVLEKLTDLLNSANNKETRNLFSELLLTVPAKLHVLCPYLYLMVTPILYALQPGSREEAVGFALRNLDMMVTSLRNESLEPILKPVISELLKALFSHLRPQPYQYGPLAMKILAKLGGTNRQYMNELTNVNTKPSTKPGLSLGVTFNSDNSMMDTFTAEERKINNTFVIDDFVDNTIDICFDKNEEIEVRKNAFEFLKTSLISMISVDANDLNLKDEFKLMPLLSTPKFKLSYLSATCPRIYYPFSTHSELEDDSIKVNGEFKTTLTYEGEIEMFTKLLKNVFLFVQCAIEENLYECIEFVKGLCRHFALVLVSRCNSHTQASISRTKINVDWFFEVVMELYEIDCRETSQHFSVAEFVLSTFTDYLYELCGEDPEVVIQFGIWERLQSRFTHYCHQPEWHKKCVGAKGIIFLCENVTPIWLVHYELDFVRALFFSIKNAPVQMNSYTNQMMVMALETVISTCFNIPEIDLNTLGGKRSLVIKDKSEGKENEVEVQETKLNHKPIERKKQLIYYLLLELSNHSTSVRKSVQSLFKLLAELSNCPIAIVLEAFKNELSQSIRDDKFAKLNNIPQMIGFVEAVVFFLSLKESILTINAQVVNIINRALNIVNGRMDEQLSKDKDKKSLNILKISCLKLLREALVCKELRYTENVKIRSQIIEVFFKFLQTNNKDVVGIAKSGLTAFIAQQRLPKDLLQQSLRPILSNLGKHNQLNQNVLLTLANLLELCTSYFSVKLGHQLLEHLSKWSDKKNTLHINNAKERPLIAAQIISLFSLLPPDAKEVLQKLTMLTIELDNIWADETKGASPFIEPLAKYLNLYPDDAVRFFFSPISDHDNNLLVISSKKTFDFFIAILKHKKSQEIRNSLMNSQEYIVRLFQNLRVDFMEPIVLIRILSKLSPTWLSKQRMVFEQMMKMWNVYMQNTMIRPNQMEIDDNTSYLSVLDHKKIKLTKKMLKCIIAYCDNNETECAAFFDVLKIFNSYIVMDLSFLRDFFENKLGGSYPIQRKEDVIIYFCALFKREDVPLQVKLDSLKNIVIPIVKGTAERNQLLSNRVVNVLFDELYHTTPIALVKVSNEREKYSLKVEMLQLATMFVKYFPNQITDKRSFFKFAYENCNVDDATTNQCAFVLAAHFIRKFGLPDKKVLLQIYGKFLKAYKSDSKSLVRQALDIIVQPVKEIEPVDGKNKYPQWIRFTKKTLMEDVMSLPQLVHIWNMFIRHPDAFYESRDYFVPKMITSLSKIGYPSNSSMEYKKLSLQLAELIISWEQRTQSQMQLQLLGGMEIDTEIQQSSPYEDENEKKRKVNQTDLNEENTLKKRKTDASKSNIEQNEFLLNLQSRSIIMNFLAKMCLLVCSQQHRSTEKVQLGLARQAINILRKAFELWKGETINFSYIERHLPSLESIPTFSSSLLCALLELIMLLVEVNNGIIVLDGQFAKKLAPLLTTQYIDVNKNVARLFKTLLKVFNPLDPSNAGDTGIQEFYTVICAILTERISKAGASNKEAQQVNQQAPQSSTTNQQSNNLLNSYGHLLVLHIICSHYQNDSLRLQYSKIVSNLLSKLLKQKPPSIEGNQSSTITECYVGCIELCISFLADGIHQQVLKPFLSSIQHTLDRYELLGIELYKIIINDVIGNWLRVPPHLSINRTSANPLNDGDDSKVMKISKPQELLPNQKLFFLDKLSRTLEHINLEPYLELKRTFYELILELYQKIDLFQNDIQYYRKLESVFISGLRIEIKELKDIKLKFLATLNQRTGKLPYERLQFAIDSQRWESLCDTFWIKHALDVLLYSIDTTASLSAAPGTATLPSISLQQSYDNSLRTQTTEKPTALVTSLTEKSKLTIREHEQFLAKHFLNLTADSIFTPLRILCRDNINLSFNAWVQVFSLVWDTLSIAEKQSIQTPFLALLARDYHAKQYVKYPNVIQALLDGVTKTILKESSKSDRDILLGNVMPSPTISISPDMLKFIGKSFNAWSLSIPILEEELRSLISSGTFDEKTEKVCNSLCELYRVLKEEDMLCAIWRSCDVTDYTRLMLSLEQRNMWNETQEVLKEMIFGFQKGNIIKKRVSHTELHLWEDHWLTCSKKLQQWEELTKYSQFSVTNSSVLMLECLWKNGNWNQMKELFQKHPASENQLLKIYQISCMIMQDKDTEANECYQQAQQLALQRWCALPSFLCSNHNHILHNFQQLYELHESANLLNDAKKPLSTTELKGFLTTWRDRIPNKWDDISMWNDILTWRYHFLKRMSEKFEDLKEEHHRALCLNEAIWTLNKFAKITRKQNLVEPGLRMLADSGKLLMNLKTETTESFVRVYEILKCFLQDGRYNEALDLIDSDTSMSSKLKTNQKIEILRLRGEFLSRCDKNDDSYQTFSQSVSYFPQDQRYLTSVTSTPALGKSFFYWARLLDKLFVEKWNSGARNQKQKQSTKHPTQSMTAMDFAEHCLASYLLAIRYSGGAANHQSIVSIGGNIRQHIGRVLWLLSFDTETPTTIKTTAPVQNNPNQPNQPQQQATTTEIINVGPLYKIAEKSINDIPAWMWIPWHQQLFSMLQRKDSESLIAKQILMATLNAFPQAIFQLLRSTYYDIREYAVRQQKKQQSSETPPPLTHSTPNIHVSIKPSSTESSSNQPLDQHITKYKKRIDELMSNAFSTNRSLIHDIENILKDITKFKPEVEEEFVRALRILLEQCYKYNIYKDEATNNLMKDDGEDDDHSIPVEIIELTRKIVVTYLTEPTPTPQQSSSSSATPQPRTTSLIENKNVIISELLPRKERKELVGNNEERGPKTLLELTSNIKKRITLILKRINTLPKQIHLESKCRSVEQRTTFDIEIPGQYELVSDREPFAERHEKYLCILPDMDVVIRNKTSSRRIKLRSTSGKVFVFLIQTNPQFEPTGHFKTEERLISLVRHLNRILERDKTARSHNYLKIDLPIVLPLNQRLRLVREDCQDYTSMEDIFLHYCESKGIPLDDPILKYWKIMNDSCQVHQHDFETKLNTFNQMIEADHFSMTTDNDVNIIPNDILKNYIRGICPSWSFYYQVRKTFAIQIGLYSLLNYLLHMKERYPNKLLISKNSGHVFQYDLRTTLDKQTGLLTRDETVPFRLTRNITNFLTQFCVEGYLLNTIAISSHALLENRKHVETLLQLFIRDELIAWQNIDSNTLNGMQFLENEEHLRGTVQKNTDKMMTMLNDLSPVLPPYLLPNTAPPQPTTKSKKSKKEATSSTTTAAGTSEVQTPTITTPITPTSVATPTNIVPEGMLPPSVSSNTTTGIPTNVTTTPQYQHLLEVPPLNQKVYELIQQASSNDKLCMMDPNFYPWF